MKPVLAALVSASLVAMPLAAAAQHHGGRSGGGSPSSPSGASPGSSGGGFGAMRAPSGGWRGPSGSTWSGRSWGGPGGAWTGGARSGFHHHFHDRFPVFFGGFGLGFALGSAWDPWFWDAPYYGYPAYTVVEHDNAYPRDDGYFYDRYNHDYAAAPSPPGAQASPPPTGPCDKWQWDAAKAQYDWIACPAASPPPR